MGHCYSCGKQEKLEETNVVEIPDKPEVVQLAVQTGEIVEPYRSIRPKTLRKFNTRKLLGGSERGVVYDYGPGVQKIRLAGKKFQWVNYPRKGLTLYGAHHFPQGGKYISITEGENDAMAIYDMMGDYPVVSLSNGASSVKRLTTEDHSYLNSFEQITVCFDNDEPGRRAVDEFCAVFPSKTKVVHLPKEFKDPHDMLVAGEREKFRIRWWKAGSWSPTNIVFPIDILDSIVKPKSYNIVPYPCDGLNDQIKGFHEQELITLSAGPKVGKSMITAWFVHHLYKHTDARIADITVENTPDERNRTLLSFQVGKPLHLMMAGEDVGISREQLETEARKFFKDRRIVSFERDGITKVDQIFDKINYMVEVLGCKYVIFDHVNYATSYHEQDERKALDSISNRLADLAKDKRICLIVVSHENDEGKLFGSRNLVKASHTVMRFERDKHNADPIIRNLTKLTVTESRRYGARIGPPIYLKFNEEKYSLFETDREWAEDLIGKGNEKDG